VIGSVERENLAICGLGGITNEASGGMGVKANHEEESKMMCVPESLETLSTDLVVGGAVHKNHDEKHEVTGDTTRLSIVDLEGRLRADLYELFSLTPLWSEREDLRVSSTLKKLT
jgi:hypothetical protein